MNDCSKHKQSLAEKELTLEEELIPVPSKRQSINKINWAYRKMKKRKEEKRKQ